MDGIINVYKEAGFTSFDVVAKLRGILHQKKIGHTGTLDPAAEGVLPVCVGMATRACEMLTDHDKTYRAVMRLGVTTDTEDMTGEVLSTSPVNVTEEEILRAVAAHVGTYGQIPPMYSAIKVNGKKLYDLARKGEVIERAPREVTIHSIKVEEIRMPLVTMTVSCSKGTYIRSLCRDIGEKLGCGGAMESLLRTQTGVFTLENAKKLSEIEQLRDAGRLDEILIPAGEIFPEIPKVVLPREAERFGYNGNALADEIFEGFERKEGSMFRIFDGAEHFLGIYQYKKGCFKPYKMFLTQELAAEWRSAREKEQE